MLGPYFNRKGGVVIHTQKIIKYLAMHKGCELHLVTFGEKNSDFIKNNIHFHIIKKWINLPDPLLLFQIHDLRKVIENISPDIIHAQGTFPPYSTALLKLNERFKSIVTVHGISFLEVKYKSGFDYVFHSIFSVRNEKNVLNKIQNLITVSPQAKEILETETTSKIFTISNGIEYNHILNNIRRISLKHPSIFFLGVLRREKAVELLLEALPRVIKSHPNIHLYIGGSGPQEQELKRKVIEFEIENYVTFLGFLSEDEKYEYYASADIYILPSIYENEPITILEAMACGKPIIASRIYGIPYLVRDNYNGFLFESGNVDDLSEKIITIFNDIDRLNSMGQRSQNVASNYDWSTIANQTFQVYELIKG